jgi:dipeptidyl aminopeptidase/acylaminoacyl peptidase
MMRYSSCLLPAAALAAAAFVSACDDSTGPQDLIVEGVNLTQLFAPVTTAEVDAVLDDWAARSITAASIDTAIDTALTLTAPTLGTVDVELRIVSHLVGSVRHYGAIIVPAGAQPGSLPVLLYLHGGDSGESLDGLLALLPFVLDEDLDDFVFVVPSFRAERLTFAGVNYLSDGPPSPWDRDVDDALALLEVTLEITPAADVQRVGAIGFSRGACVAMLMAERDPRIDLVVEFFGPTDFFGPFVQQVTKEALQGDPRDLPGLAYLNNAFIQPLKNGDLTIDEVRLEMARRSPVYYAQQLPQLQVHHGTADETVPVGEAERLIEVMVGLGRGEPDFESYLYLGGGHDLNLPGAIDRTREFIGRLKTVIVTAN